jgi:hypothetical protein
MIPSRFSVLWCTPLLCAGIAVQASQPPAQARKPAPRDVVFKKIVIDPEFRSEGVTVADVNRDRKLDILAGNFWYEAPDWKPHEIAPAQKFDPAKGYSNSFLDFTLDVDGDGWPDQIVVGFPGREAFWRQNPQRKTGHWKEYPIARNAMTESPIFAKFFGARNPVLVFPYDARSMAWYEPNKDLSQEFTRHLISETGPQASKIRMHGLGVGDVNGDGRADVLTTDGYWEAPKDPRTGPWKFVPARLGPDCAQMIAYDVNGDGLPDVLSSSAHAIGVWWHEQRKGPNGPEFVQHVIDDSFSQAHALVLADINGDGLMDIVTGKRFWAHGPKGDVRPEDPCVLYWFELRRNGSEVQWIRHQIDNDSGVGTQFEVVDLNRDGLPDLVVANKKGVFLFQQQRSGAQAR